MCFVGPLLAFRLPFASFYVLARTALFVPVSRGPLPFLSAIVFSSDLVKELYLTFDVSTYLDYSLVSTLCTGSRDF